jgi:hypothetical protein
MRTKHLAIIAIALGLLGYAGPVLADVPDAGVVLVDAGAPVAAPVATPASDLANPVDDPIAAIDDARQAKKQGWSLFALALVVMLTAGLSRAAERWPTWPVLESIAKNKTVLYVIACVAAMGAASYNAAFDGGSPYAIAYAAGGALLLFIAPKPKAA